MDEVRQLLEQVQEFRSSAEAIEADIHKKNEDLILRTEELQKEAEKLQSLLAVEEEERYSQITLLRAQEEEALKKVRILSKKNITGFKLKEFGISVSYSVSYEEQWAWPKTQPERHLLEDLLKNTKVEGDPVMTYKVNLETLKHAVESGKLPRRVLDNIKEVPKRKTVRIGKYNG